MSSNGFRDSADVISFAPQSLDFGHVLLAPQKIQFLAGDIHHGPSLRLSSAFQHLESLSEAFRKRLHVWRQNAELTVILNLVLPRHPPLGADHVRLFGKAQFAP